MNCEQHPDREGTLTVDLPSIGVQRYMCDACIEAFRASLTPYQGKREAWDHAGYDYQMIGGDIYTRTSAGWRTEHVTRERDWK